MKAQPEDQLALLQLQEVDSALVQVAHRIKAPANRAELQRLGAEVAEADALVVRLRTESFDLQRGITRAHAELDMVRRRQARDQDALRSGAGVRIQRDLMHEVESLKRRVGDLEDTELELMLRAEELDEELQRTGERCAALSQQLGAAQRVADEETAGARREQHELQQRRASLVAGLPAALVALYRDSRNTVGVGAAALVGDRCGGCRLSIPGAELAQIRSAPADEVQHCEECGCIVVRTE